MISVSTAPLQAIGYQVHDGTPADGYLDGRFWWTRFQPGWLEVESSQGDYDTAEMAWLAAAEAEGADPLPPVH